jgi:hypothetical protein
MSLEGLIDSPSTEFVHDIKAGSKQLSMAAEGRLKQNR